jgi:uncharacterized protein YvpB
MRVANNERGLRIESRLVVMSLVVALLLVSCVGAGVEPEDEIQFSLPVVEQAATKESSKTVTVSALPTMPDRPTMSEDDLSVVVTSEVVELPVPEQTREVEPAKELPAVLPEEFYIRNITGHRQYYPLGCEASVSIDLANYFGISINESEFQNRLPLSDNPDYGFVGIVTGPWGQVPPYAYGVHAGPIANLLREYGLNAKGEKQFTVERLKAEVASGQPVIAWVIGNVVGGIPHEYEDSLGRKVTVAAYEHVVIVTGYSNDAGTLRYMNNGKFYDVPVDHFDNSWAVLERMVVYVAD